MDTLSDFANSDARPLQLLQRQPLRVMRLIDALTRLNLLKSTFLCLMVSYNVACPGSWYSFITRLDYRQGILMFFQSTGNLS